MTASTDPARQDTTILDAVHSGRSAHRTPIGIGAGGDPFTAPTPTSRVTRPRTIRLRTAAVIAVVAFVLGLGVSMLLGPILGPGPGGPGGRNGATTSQQSTIDGGATGS